MYILNLVRIHILVFWVKFLPWKWKQYIGPKRRYRSTRLHFFGRISWSTLWASRKVGIISDRFDQKFNFVKKFYLRSQAEPTRFHLNSHSNFGDRTQERKDTVGRHDQPHQGALCTLCNGYTNVYDHRHSRPFGLAISNLSRISRIFAKLLATHAVYFRLRFNCTFNFNIFLNKNCSVWLNNCG
jgi:hypothetical protein